MKINRLFTYICGVALGCMFNACSDDDKVVIPEIPQGIDFTFTPYDVTVSTFDFELKVSNQDAPYVCLYVPRTIIDRVPKHELPDFLMEDLRKQAEVASKPFTQYLAEISHKGNKEFHLDGLMRGTLYELVTFTVNREWKSEEADYFFFHTLKVTPTDCTFEVTGDKKPDTFNVVPSDKNAKWYLSMLEKNFYEELIDDGYDDTSILYELINADIEEGYNKAYEDGILTDKEAQEVIDGLFFQGDVRLTFNNSIPENTEFRWIVAAFDQFEWDLIPISDIQGGYVTINAADTESSLNVRSSSDVPNIVWKGIPRRYLPIAHPVK